MMHCEYEMFAVFICMTWHKLETSIIRIGVTNKKVWFLKQIISEWCVGNKPNETLLKINIYPVKFGALLIR
jgi:hypothetical protein